MSMQESTRTAIMIEAVFYESVINGLVDAHNNDLNLGLSREELLYGLTAQLLNEVSTPERMCSVAAMAVVMLAEERQPV